MPSNCNLEKKKEERAKDTVIVTFPCLTDSSVSAKNALQERLFALAVTMILGEEKTLPVLRIETGSIALSRRLFDCHSDTAT